MCLRDAKFAHFKIKIKKDSSCIFIFILPFIFIYFTSFFIANLASNQSLYQEWGLDEGWWRMEEGWSREKELNKKGKEKLHAKSYISNGPL